MRKLTSLESQVLFKLAGLIAKRFLIASDTEGLGRVLLSDRGLAYMTRAIPALDDPHEEDECPDWDYKRDLMRLIGRHHYTVDGAYDEIRAWAFHG